MVMDFIQRENSGLGIAASDKVIVYWSCGELSLVLYMSSSFWLLEVDSRDFSQAEKETTACKCEQIHKMTTIFTQNDNLGPFFLLSMRKII